MEQENTKYVRICEFPRALEGVESYGSYLGFNELIEIVKNCELFRKDGRIIEEVKEEDIISTEPRPFALVKVGDTEYRFRREHESSGHRWGDGGESGSYHFLQKNGDDVLVSLHFVAYHTYSDDSEDHPGKDIRKTLLLKEDGLAKQVFEEIKRSNKKS